MIKKILPLLFFILLCTPFINAQNPKHPRLSKEEFRKRQELYLTKKAEFTNEEAAQFFPIFFELEDKKKEINDKVWEVSRSCKKQKLSEEEYDKLLRSLNNARLTTDKLDITYLPRFRKVVSAEKLFKFKMAEMRFHRDMLKVMHTHNNPKNK